MGDTSEYQTYVVNIESRNNKSRKNYVSFGDVCFKIEFTEACSSKLVIYLSRFYILRIEVKDMETTY